MDIRNDWEIERSARDRNEWQKSTRAVPSAVPRAQSGNLPRKIDSTSCIAPESGQSSLFREVHKKYSVTRLFAQKTVNKQSSSVPSNYSTEIFLEGRLPLGSVAVSNSYVPQHFLLFRSASGMPIGEKIGAGRSWKSNEEDNRLDYKYENNYPQKKCLVKGIITCT